MLFSRDELYACGEEGGNVAGIVTWDPTLSVITWFQPGGRNRAYDVVEVIEDSDARFAFMDNQGRKFVLFPLTPDYYNAHIRRPRQPAYLTREALMQAYRASLG